MSVDMRVFDTKPDLGRAAAERAAAAIGEAIARAGEARVIAATGASQFEFLDALTARRTSTGGGSRCSTSTSTSG